MNVAPHRREQQSATIAEPRPASVRMALLGTGNVGSAVLARLAGWAGTPLGGRLTLVYAANSRVALHDDGGLFPCPDGTFDAAISEPFHLLRSLASRGRTATPGPQGRMINAHPRELDHIARHLGDGDTRILIDATASEAVVARHADWLGQGIHVVTACKLGQGSSLARWRAIQTAAKQGRASYGDSATVGAGLPLLRTIRELQSGGDTIHSIAGVLSGSLAWLFNHYDGMQPFSQLVRQARDAGYTEPDPREDLSGEDVRRKILILARAAGVPLASDEVEVASLVPEALALVTREQVDAALPALDAPLRARFAAARQRGETLRFIARLDRSGKGCVGLESLPQNHPLATGAGTDNKLVIWSDRYRDQPLVIQGPGAGAEVTAAGLLDDVLRIARPTPD